MTHVGLDIRPLAFTRAGIRTYLYNLILGLSRIGGCRMSLFTSAKSGLTWKDISPDITEELIRLPQINSWCESFWQKFLLPRAARRSRIEIFHGARFFIPPGLDCPCVVTIHDLAFKKFPGLVLPKSGKYFDNLVASSVKSADKFITPSLATKIDLQELYGVSPDKIVVVHEAAAPEFSCRDDPDKVAMLKRRLGIKEKFILAVGTIEPRKNYSNLLKAYKMLKIQDGLQLVLAGGWGWLYEEVIKTVKDLGLKDKVIFTGHLDIVELGQLYSSCEVFVFPSLYEGFGLPVLEALQSGACVVASDTSSLKELFGESCYLVKPESAESIAAGIEHVLFDSNLRAQLKARGKTRAGDFSWDKAARQTLAVYNSLKDNRR